MVHYPQISEAGMRLAKLRLTEWIKADDVLALLFRLHLNDGFIFLRDEKARRVGRLEHVDEQIIRQHVQLLHLLSLDVRWAGYSVAKIKINLLVSNKIESPKLLIQWLIWWYIGGSVSECLSVW